MTDDSFKPMTGDTTTPDDLSDDELVQFVVNMGTFTAAGSDFGWSREKFTRYLAGRGLKTRVDQALLDAKEPKPATAPELHEDVTPEERLRQEKKELERQIRKEREGKVYEDRIINSVIEAIPYVEPRFKPLDVPTEPSDTEHEFVLLFSDTHAGEVVTREATLGMNEYNWDVMLDRMAKIQRSVLSYQAHRPYPVRKLHVATLGDMLSGDIHDELTETNDRNMGEATVQFGYDFAEFLTGFGPHFEEIYVPGVPGNHPRRNRKPQAKNANNNADWISYKVAEALLKNDKSIHFDLPAASYVSHTVAGQWRFLLMHGDGIRTTMPGVPWGGVVRRMTTLEQQFAHAKQPIDYFALGHFHTANALDGVGTKTFLNGSVKGLDEYGLKSFGSGRGPSQLLLTVHPRNGITDVSYIDLEPVGPAGGTLHEVQR